MAVLRSLILAFAAVATLSACGEKEAAAPVADAAQIKARLTGDEAAKDELVKLYQAARAAGEPGATIYVASVPEELKPLATEFAATFPGLIADYQRYIGDKLAARLDGEYASGKHTGDTILSSVIEARRYGEIGRLTAWTPPTLGALDAAYRDPKGAWFVPYKKTFTLAYNPNLVPQAEVPKTFADVLQPKWRGRYTFPSSGATGPSATTLSLLADRGDVTDADVATFDKYGTGGPASSELIPSVAQGRYAFALWTNAAAVIAQRDGGAPLQVAFSPSLSSLSNVASGILSKAPHPHSARLFTAWLFTPKAQAILADLYFYGAQPGAPIPQGFPQQSEFINGAIPEDEAYAAKITAFQKHRAALAAANR